MRRGILTAQELCASCQERIKKTKSLNMYVTETMSEEVHKQAEVSHLAYKKGGSFISLKILRCIIMCVK